MGSLFITAPLLLNILFSLVAAPAAPVHTIFFMVILIWLWVLVAALADTEQVQPQSQKAQLTHL
jgi:hypothetical protein